MGYKLGLGGPYHHDTSACLVDGEGSVVAFVEEERFTRRKHNKDSRSCAHSAAYCLTNAGIHLSDVEEIAVAWNPAWPTDADQITDGQLIRELLDPACFDGYTPRRLTIIEHHIAHAASAFYPSGFDDSAVLVVDGSGDGISTSLYHGTPTGLKTLRQYPFTQSLGWFYETVAEHLGLGDWTSSGKLMGLAAYGNPTYDLSFLATDATGYRLDLTKYGLPPGIEATSDYTDLGYYHQLKRAYRNAFTDVGVPAHRRTPRYEPTTGRMIADTGFTPHHADLAASAQHLLQQCLLDLAHDVLTQTGSSHLCIGGGVGLNCTANGVLHRQSGATRMFVQPAAGDAGCAIGAALECARRSGTLQIPGKPQVSTASGPDFTDEHIAAILRANHIRHTYHGDTITEPVTGALAGGSIIGWFQGACEGGPRALGQRSILADPRTTSSRDTINRDIKCREPWRPLAPSILADAMNRFVIDPGPTEFMIVAHQATDHARTTIPATVHVDASVRPQAVHDHVTPRYAQLLRAFDAATGVPALLNTSFNHEAEPIVCTPTDALRTFFSTPLDALALGGFLIRKDAQ